MITKNHILDEIKRIAKESGGSPPGSQRFYTETGIKNYEWERYWARWGDALTEAGFVPNPKTLAYDPNLLLQKLAGLARELGHFPTDREINVKTRNDNSFPSKTTFISRLGSKNAQGEKLLEWCNARAGFEDVAALCAPLLEEKPKAIGPSTGQETYGYVYLLKSGRYYKIGQSKAVGRREYELAIQLPEKPKLVHSIKTDDPVGIEHYWHRRFADRRGEKSEFFKLTAQDISAFKRRKFM